MHILKIDSRIEIGPKDVIGPGEHLATDIVAAQLLLMADGGTMTPLDQHRPFRDDRDWNGRRLLFLRVGGFGDLILLTPVLREIKRRWPTSHIAVSTMSHYAPVFSGLPFVDEIVPFPLPWSVAEEFDAWVFYENSIEKNPRAHEIHATELFAEITGLGGIENLLPAYMVKPSEAIWAQEAYPRVPNVRRACVQVATSARCRVYSEMGLVCTLLCDQGWEILLLGEKGGPNEPKMPPEDKLPPTLRNLIPSGLSFRQSSAVLATADVFIGPDSSLLHVAGALGVPAVGLYGPFPWKLRTAHCPTTIALSGAGDCAPCFHHVNGTMKNHFPAHCPSAKTGYCGVLKDIKPERVAAKADQIARQYREPQFAFPL